MVTDEQLAALRKAATTLRDATSSLPHETGTWCTCNRYHTNSACELMAFIATLMARATPDERIADQYKAVADVLRELYPEPVFA